MNWKLTTAATAAAFVSALAIAIANPIPMETTQAQNPNVMEELREVEMNIAAIAEHAAKLEQMLEMPNTMSHSAHEFEWNMIDARFDEAGKKIPELQEATGMEPWKKDIIDDISALMAAMGNQIEAGTKVLGDTTAVERLHTRSHYPLRIRSVYRYAEMIDDHIEVLQEWNETTS